ncbi:hypothetical protein ACFQ1M_04645 [Sungkyunkwania multivorans]|uniref:Uncharacterized protein n=1 Tax=Sungkyunkwania multivorans TaxID=1173618 RepID=A0ABW3CX85_9FLAO
MRETITTTLIILVVSTLSFFWMMSGEYQTAFEWIFPDGKSLANANLLIKMLAILFFGLLWIILTAISCLFALIWPIGVICAVVVFFGGSFSALFGKSKSNYYSGGNSGYGYSDNYNSKSSNYSDKHYVPSNSSNQKIKKKVGGIKGTTTYDGENWFNEKKVGRTDSDGNVYEGENWFTEKKTGRISSDGTTYEGDNWFSEKKTGRIDKDGNIYEGDNWFNEKKVGRIGKDGNVYEGDNWFTEKKVGKHKK